MDSLDWIKKGGFRWIFHFQWTRPCGKEFFSIFGGFVKNRWYGTPSNHPYHFISIYQFSILSPSSSRGSLMEPLEPAAKADASAADAAATAM